MDLRAYRKAAGMTLDDFAKVIGVKGATVSRWERGEIAMSLPQAMEIAKVTGGKVTLSDLATAYPEPAPA